MRLLCARNGGHPNKSHSLNSSHVERQTPAQVGQSIRVATQGGVPTRIEWGGRAWRVESVEAVWCIEGRWWLDAERSGARRQCFRVGLSSANGQTLWLDIAHQGAEWRALRCAD